MLRFKQGPKGARLAGLRPEMIPVMQIATECYGGFDCWVTSGTEGKHGKSSRHFVGLALDFRTSAAGIEIKDAERIAADMRARLTDEFDVVVESDHIHVEYDPKVGVNT